MERNSFFTAPRKRKGALKSDMTFSEKKINELRLAIKNFMSEKRYAHTLGVEATASELFREISDESDAEIRCAALLHDIAKEADGDELISVLKATDGITDEDIASEAAHHALAAPCFVKRYFPEYASEKVLSAVFNHTTGAQDMSLFDEIVFLADYIEPGRLYESCRVCRELLYPALKQAKSRDERIAAIHDATKRALLDTISKLTEWGKRINPRTISAYEFYAK